MPNQPRGITSPAQPAQQAQQAQRGSTPAGQAHAPGQVGADDFGLYASRVSAAAQAELASRTVCWAGMVPNCELCKAVLFVGTGIIMRDILLVACPLAVSSRAYSRVTTWLLLSGWLQLLCPLL